MNRERSQVQIDPIWTIYLAINQHLYLQIVPETLQDLLFYSDHYMIHGLKLGCGGLLATQLNSVNAVQTLSLARLLMMSKLQHAALKFIAYNFENVS